MSHLPQELQPLQIGRLPHSRHVSRYLGRYRYSSSIGNPIASCRLNRIAERNGTYLLAYAEQLGMGTRKYVLITIE